MKTPSRCYQCKAKDFEEIFERVERTVGRYRFEADLRAWRCVSCGESVFALSEIGRFERELAGWLAREGVLSGEAFRFMRKAIGLRANELAQLLDLSPETVSRWEKEHRQPDRRAMMVLGNLVLDRLNGQDETLKRLQALGSSQEGSASVDLTESLQAA